MFNLNIASRLGIADKYKNIFRIINKFKKRLKIYYRNEPKIFVIGLNKTGTTTVFYALKELGVDMSYQHNAERIYNGILDGTKSDLDILNHCNYYEGFQDIPFSVPGYYKLLDKRFKRSKFILTIRGSDKEWYNSFKNYYDIEASLAENNYIGKGFLFRVFQKIFDTTDFNAENCLRVYNEHYNDVLDYFKDRPQDLLVLNVSNDDSYKELCKFINKNPIRMKFEWRNKTARSEIKQII